MSNFFPNQRGVTLVELIIAMVIISIASVALLQGLGQQTRNNVDPMIQSQAQMLAKQYLLEVSSKSFFDPAADPRLNPTLSNAQINSSITDKTSSGASNNRLLWNNLYEYEGYSSVVYDVDGTPIANLASFSVDITIDISSGLDLGTLSNSLVPNCPPKIAYITVTVTDTRNQKTSLSGYRTSYWDPGC